MPTENPATAAVVVDDAWEVWGGRRGRERKVIHNQGFKEHTQRIPAAAVVSLPGRK